MRANVNGSFLLIPIPFRPYFKQFSRKRTPQIDLHVFIIITYNVCLFMYLCLCSLLVDVVLIVCYYGTKVITLSFNVGNFQILKKVKKHNKTLQTFETGRKATNSLSKNQQSNNNNLIIQYLLLACHYCVVS